MNLEHRIAELEKQTKLQRFGIFGLGIALATTMLLAMTTQSPTDLTASSFSVLNKDGKPTITINNEGISILDENGTARVGIGADPKTKRVGMAFMDKNSTPRVAIGTTESGEAGITLIGAGMSEMMSGSSWPPAKK